MLGFWCLFFDHKPVWGEWRSYAGGRLLIRENRCRRCGAYFSTEIKDGDGKAVS